MTRFLRTACGFAAVLAMTIVSGCSTPESDTVLVETWGVQTTKVGDGPAQTTRTHTVGERAVPVVPEKPCWETGG
ncbi:MAG: hypothetical protein K8F25_07145 [Fimbriimonadaceae bacterium]|nr:hypothetical protein [Alphaproteobacteria bacterium]